MQSCKKILGIILNLNTSVVTLRFLSVVEALNMLTMKFDPKHNVKLLGIFDIL